MTWPRKKLGEILDYEQPGEYIVASKNYSNDYKTPVLTAGKTFILGNTSEKENIFPVSKLPVIIFDDFTTATQFVGFPFKVKSSAMKILHAKKGEADAKYFFYLMQTIKVNHATHKRFWISEYSKIEVPVPPIAEQKKIVARLEKLLAKIKEVKKLRADAQEATKSLLSVELHKIFEEGKLEKWEEWELGSIAKFSQGIQVGLELQKKEPTDGYVRFIRIVDYTKNTSDIRYVKNPGEKYFVNEGDIVMIRYGSPGVIGRGIKGVIANNLFKISLNSKIISNDFFVYFISQNSIQNIFREGGSTTMPAVNFKTVSRIKILVPLVAEQKKIVERLDKLSEKIKELQEYQNQTQADLVALEKSILHQAFAN